MIAGRIILAAGIISALILGVGHRAHSRTMFPSVRELEAALSLWPGAPLPKLVPTRNGLFQPHYVSAVERGNGEYIVIIKLDRQR